MKVHKFYSKVNKTKLLHLVCQLDPAEETTFRQEIIDEKEFLQCSVIGLEPKVSFRPHKHIYKKRTYEQQIAQESWVVIRGSVKFIFYDLDDTILDTFILRPGDASYTLHGGHNYEILEKNTLVYEYKTGPYEGQKLDKTFIGE